MEQIRFKHNCLSSIPCTKFDLVPVECNSSLKSAFDRKQVERIPEWVVGVELGWPPWLAVLVNQQVWCSSTSVGGDRHKETRERGRLQWARWPSAWDWRIDLSPKSNLEDGHNPGLMIAERVSQRHWCDKEDGDAAEHWALCTVWQIVPLFLASRICTKISYSSTSADTLIKSGLACLKCND